MPRKNPFPPREAEICRRVREFRISTGLSQVIFAKRIGTDSSRLASHEHCRSPIKYALADCLADEFDICQRWLATGKLPDRGYVDIAPAIQAELQPDYLFSEVYDKQLASLIDAFIAGIAETFKCSEAEVDGKKAFDVRASPAGSEEWDIIKKMLITGASFKGRRKGFGPSPFVKELTKLLDDIFPNTPPLGSNNNRAEATRLIDGLLTQVLEYKNAMTEERAVNYLKQVAHYAWKLGEDYTNQKRRSMLALANSRVPNARKKVTSSKAKK